MSHHTCYNTLCYSLQQLVIAVEYIHQKGHIHRDLKVCCILLLYIPVMENAFFKNNTSEGKVFDQKENQLTLPKAMPSVYNIFLQPSNILFAPDGAVKVGDFGLVAEWQPCIEEKGGNNGTLSLSPCLPLPSLSSHHHNFLYFIKFKYRGETTVQ